MGSSWVHTRGCLLKTPGKPSKKLRMELVLKEFLKEFVKKRMKFVKGSMKKEKIALF